jgi:hypothetical protein
MTLSVLDDVFEFDAETHRYRLNGVTLPGITQTLDLTGFVDKKHFTEESRRRGKDIHLACLYLTEGRLDWNTLAPEYRPRVEAFAQFLADKRPAVILAEKPLYSKIYSFAGTPDFLFDMDGPTLVDVKTGRGGLAAKLQTAGQAVLVTERMPDIKRVRRFFLELSDNGRYKLMPCFNNNDRVMFLNAVAMVHTRINEKELKI